MDELGDRALDECEGGIFDQAKRHREKYEQSPDCWTQEKYDALLAKFTQIAPEVLETFKDCTSIIIFGSFARSYKRKKVWMHDESNINIVPVFRQFVDRMELTMDHANAVSARLTSVLDRGVYVDAHEPLFHTDAEGLIELAKKFFHDRILIVDNPIHGEDTKLRELLDLEEVDIRYHTISTNNIRESNT